MKRRFRLPTYLELSKEQDRILRKLQSLERAIISGAPGTGKSVIILLLADTLCRSKAACLCLLYTRMLKEMSLGLIPGINIQTWHLWFKHFFANRYRKSPPRLTPFEYDWPKVMALMDQHNLDLEEKITVLIDEGQDMPPEFYEFMDESFLKIVVSADENQQIWQNNSCLKEIKEMLDVDRNACFELRQNYRNSRQIAQLAQTFYCDTVAKPPELPERNGEIPLLIDYPDRNALINRIVRRHRIYPDRLIAILLPKEGLRNHYYQALQQRGISSLHTYSGKLGRQNRPITFDHGGIVVINQQSAKGLEFDEVFIAELDQFYFSEDREAFRKQLYVLTSRAREQLFILMNSRTHPAKCRQIIAEFPDDPAILRRWPPPTGTDLSNLS